MREQLRLFFVAWQFLTRIPLGKSIEHWIAWTPERLRASARYFPLVGIVIGAIAALVYSLAANVFGTLVAVVSTLSATAVATGAFHEDGWIDYFDSFGAYGNRERALAIMKDSRIGSFGALAIVLLVTLKIAVLISIPYALVSWALIASHGVGRASACAVMYALPYVRDIDQSKSKPMADGIHMLELTIACGIAALPMIAIYVCSVTSVHALAGSLFVTLVAVGLFALHLRRRLQGFTGDTLGATEQLAEISWLLGLLAMTR